MVMLDDRDLVRPVSLRHVLMWAQRSSFSQDTYLLVTFVEYETNKLGNFCV